MTGAYPRMRGATNTQQLSDAGGGAYPRMRGATVLGGNQGDAVKGLSPHARGNRQETVEQLTIAGPIPACAGQPDRGDSERN